MRVTNPAAQELLVQLFTIANRLNVAHQPGWLSVVESYRLQGYGEPLLMAGIRGLEERAGGYWIDTTSMDLGTHSLADTRFIHRDMCVRCCSLRKDHVEIDAQLRCLFAPGSTFEETKP